MSSNSKDRQKAASRPHALRNEGEGDGGRDRRSHRQHQPPPYDSAAAVGDGETDSAAATGSASSGSKSPSSNESDMEFDPPRFRPAFGTDIDDEPIETDVYQPGIGLDAFEYNPDEAEEDARERARRSANTDPLSTIHMLFPLYNYSTNRKFYLLSQTLVHFLVTQCPRTAATMSSPSPRLQTTLSCVTAIVPRSSLVLYKMLSEPPFINSAHLMYGLYTCTLFYIRMPVLCCFPKVRIREYPRLHDLIFI